MRLVSAALFAGFIVSIAGLSIAPEGDGGKPSVDKVTTAIDEVDPIVTGNRISEEHKAKWQLQHEAYIKCPECVASQPYPGD